MFLVDDTPAERHNRIRAFDGQDIFIGVVLATMDFEWTVRRAILGLGYQKNSTIRAEVLARCTGLEKYKQAWKQQVQPRFGTSLTSIVPEWHFFFTEAFPLRHVLVHGVKGSTGVEYARRRRDCILSASQAVIEFAAKNGVDIYAKLPVRRKDLEVSR